MPYGPDLRPADQGRGGAQAPFPDGRLPDLLRAHNGTYRERAHIRLRVAVNVGPVTSDSLGIAGHALNRTARLVDAPVIKKAMTVSGASLGIIVSDFVYENAIKHSAEWINAGEYKPHRIRVKESSISGWLRLIDQAPEFQLRAQ